LRASLPGCVFRNRATFNGRFLTAAVLPFVPSGIIFSFEQIGITFRQEALVNLEIFQNAAGLNYFLETAEK
jgi:hypothetical protein